MKGKLTKGRKNLSDGCLIIIQLKQGGGEAATDCWALQLYTYSVVSGSR